MDMSGKPYLRSAVFLRNWEKPLPVAARGEGAWIVDTDGNRYLDLSGGPICVNIGHGRRKVAEAIARQAEAIAYAHPTMFTTDPVERLARKLRAVAPEGITHFYFTGSGSEAVETALKLARQIQIARGNATRYKIVGRWHSYHGCTLGTLAAGGKPKMRKPFAPMLPDFIHIPPPYCLRCPYGLQHPDCGLRCAHALEEIILKEGPEQIAAFIAEPVSGATLAAVVPPPGYFRVIREICDRYDVLLIFDEVMTGLGRTGQWFASEDTGVAPDIVTLGKGLGGGYLPISATGCRQEHLSLMDETTGPFVHGHTYSHHPVCAAAALAVLEVIEKENLIERVRRLEPLIRNSLESLLNHPHVADVRGKGFMWGIEFVRDKAALTPFPRQAKVTERLFNALFERGVLVYKCVGVAGVEGDAIMIGPPFSIPENELKTGLQIIREVLESEDFRDMPSGM